jgi:hypothetical protein
VPETQLLSGYLWGYLCLSDVIPQVLPCVRCEDRWVVHFARHPGEEALWRQRGWARAQPIPYRRQPEGLTVERDLPEAGFARAEPIAATQSAACVRCGDCLDCPCGAVCATPPLKGELTDAGSAGCV